MIEYLDKEDKKLEKIFYGYDETDELFYFTGKYNKETGLPIFEKENELGHEKELPIFVVKRLYRIAKEEAREKLRELKIKTRWLEKRIEEE